MSDKRTIDWEAVELDYRAGVKTLRTIAAEHGCAESAIRKRAKRDEWERDLEAKVRQKADELVRKAEVRKAVRTTPEYVATEKEKVEVLANVQANVMLGQRKDVGVTREIFCALQQELLFQVTNIELFDKLGELMFSPDDKGVDKLNEAYKKAMSLPSRISSFKNMTDSEKVLVGIEREVFNIGSADDEKGKTLPAKADPELPPQDAYMRMIGK